MTAPKKDLASVVSIKGKSPVSAEKRAIFAQLKRFVARFGAEKANEYFLAGMTFSEAERAHDAELQRQGSRAVNERLANAAKAGRR
jgi:hypothetical protein